MFMIGFQVRWKIVSLMGGFSTLLVGGYSTSFFMFIPILMEMIQLDEHIFSDGLVKPPTRLSGSAPHNEYRKDFFSCF